MLDVNTMERAKEYVDEIRWRLDVMQYRSRYNIDTGVYKKLPTRVRRFANGIPTDIVSYVLEELNKVREITGLAFNGEEVEGAYRITTSQVKKDDSLKTGRDATYTLIQDLLLCGEPDTYEIGDSSACSGVTTSEYYWDEAAVKECPAGGQGVTYRIRDVQRDSGTDLFSFCVQKSEAVTQHMVEAVTECSDDSQVTTELWDNVYGEPGDWYWDSVVHDGAAIDIPKPCSSAQGTVVKIDYDENDDCTFKIKVTRTTSKVSGSFSEDGNKGCEFLRIRDQYQRRDMDLVRNASKSLSYNGLEYSNGKVTQYESKENSDGTWDNRVTTTLERRVKKSTVQYTVGPRFTVVSWTDTNVTEAANALPATYSYGSYKYTKTPGGLYTNEYAGYVPNLEKYGYSCEDTAYLHTHGTEESVSNSEFPTGDTHVVEAHDGIVSSTTYQKDDSTGIVSKRTQVREEHTVENAKRTVANTLLGRVVEYTHRSWDAPLGEPEVGSGVIATAEYVITDGHRYDVTWKEFEKAPAGITLSTSCAKTVFAHEDMTDLTADEVGACVEDADGGVHRRAVFTVDPQTGAIRRQELVHTELPFDFSSVQKTSTPRATTLRYVHRNTSMVAQDLKDTQISAGASEHRTTNDGKSVDVERTEVTPNVGAVLREQCQVETASHTHLTEKVMDADAELKASASSGNGKYYQQEVSVDDQNVKIQRDTSVREFEHEFGSRTHEDALQAYQIIEHTSSDVNLGDPKWPSGAGFVTDESGSPVGTANLVSAASSPFNDKRTTSRIVSGANSRATAAQMSEAITAEKLITGGGFQRGRQVVTDSELTKGGRFKTKEYRYFAKPHKWLDDIASDTYHSYVWNFRNLTQEQVEELVKDVVQKSAAVNIDDRNVHPFIRRSLNDYGLFDGTTGYEESHARQNWFNSTSSGKNSEIEEVPFTITHSWEEKSVHIRPVTELNPLSTRYVANIPAVFLVQITWTRYRSGWGVGSSSLSAAINNKKFFASPSISYDPKSQMFRATYADQQRTTIELVAGKNLPDTASATQLVGNGTNIDKLS